MLFNSMLNTNSDTLRRVVQAESIYSFVQVPAGKLNCWTLFKDCVGMSCMYKLFKLGVLLPCKSLLQIWSIGWEVRVWRDAESVDPTTHNNKVATYHSWFATPFSRNERMLTIVPRYLHLNLSKHVMRNVSRLCLRILWKLRQQRGLKMVLAYVTNVLLKMNMSRTGCTLFYFAKTTGLWAEKILMLFVYTFFRGISSSPTLFAATGQ